MWIIYITAALQISLLLCVIISDVAIRLISNKVCLMIAVLGIVTGLIIDPLLLAESIAVSAIVFFALLLLNSRGWIGGGDVKLLVALAIGLSIAQLGQFLMMTALIGGVLAAIHLMMRHLPYPRLAPAGSSLVRRVYAVERWRNLRHAPLPYGVAIAASGIWTILSHGV
jgi:prepilin peptidase CpaA